jgi:hypothetical protein
MANAEKRGLLRSFTALTPVSIPRPSESGGSSPAVGGFSKDMRRPSRTKTQASQLSESEILADNKWAMKQKLRKKSTLELRSVDGLLEFEKEAEGPRKQLGAKKSLHLMMSSSVFDTAMGLVIICNAVVIGAQIQSEIYGHDTSLYENLERVFLFIYSIELGLRFYVYRANCLRNSWVVFDLLLVSSGVLSEFIQPFVSGDENAQDDFLGVILVMRIFRLAKLARTIRLLSHFRPLWMLVSGLLSSLGTMFYILILLMIILFVFACMGVELITKNTRLRADPVFDAYVQQYWVDLPISMLTLIQFVNLDGIGAIYTPMVRSEPTMLLFFGAFMLLVSVCLMNLVTAVIVENSFEQAKSDRNVAKKERQKAMTKLMPHVRQIFQSLDKDGSGTVTLEEFGEADASIQENLEKICQTDDLVELFEMLDVDGSGSVEIEEFCEQLAEFGSVDQPFINVRLMKQLEFIRRENKENRAYNNDKFTELESELNATRLNIDERFSIFESKLSGLADNVDDMKTMMASLVKNAGLHVPESHSRCRNQIHTPGFRSADTGTTNFDTEEPLSPLSLVAEMASNEYGGGNTSASTA